MPYLRLFPPSAADGKRARRLCEGGTLVGSLTKIAPSECQFLARAAMETFGLHRARTKDVISIIPIFSYDTRVLSTAAGILFFREIQLDRRNLSTEGDLASPSLLLFRSRRPDSVFLSFSVSLCLFLSLGHSEKISRGNWTIKGDLRMCDFIDLEARLLRLPRTKVSSSSVSNARPTLVLCRLARTRRAFRDPPGGYRHEFA